jgi:hypothetical protein
MPETSFIDQVIAQVAQLGRINPAVNPASMVKVLLKERQIFAVDRHTPLAAGPNAKFVAGAKPPARQTTEIVSNTITPPVMNHRIALSFLPLELPMHIWHSYC